MARTPSPAAAAFRPRIDKNIRIRNFITLPFATQKCSEYAARKPTYSFMDLKVSHYETRRTDCHRCSKDLYTRHATIRLNPAIIAYSGNTPSYPMRGSSG